MSSGEPVSSIQQTIVNVATTDRPGRLLGPANNNIGTLQPHIILVLPKHIFFFVDSMFLCLLSSCLALSFFITECDLECGVDVINMRCCYLKIIQIRILLRTKFPMAQKNRLGYY